MDKPRVPAGQPLEFSALHKAILDCMSEAVFVVDRGMSILYSNPAAETVTGFTYRESVGKRCSEIFCEASEVCQGRCPPKRAILHNESVLHREAETKTKTGIVKQSQISVSPFYEKGECTGAVIVLKDITALRKAEEEIRTQNRFLEAVINSLVHPFRVVDAWTFEVKLANDAQRRSSLPDAETCCRASHGRNESCAAHPESPCPVITVRNTGESTVVEHIHSDPAGRTRLYEVHCYPIKHGGGPVRQVIQYSMDITERKRAEEERERLITELKEALTKVKQLGGLLPICSSCKKIRDDRGYWSQIEEYIRTHSDAEFSHSICPDCVAKLYPSVKKRSDAKK